MTIDDKFSKPINTPRRSLKVICLGAGASGLLVAYKLQRNFDEFELTIYEKNPDIAGTWFENRYPGCACDVPAHIYSYTFEPKTDWSATFAGSKEIYQYFSDFADKYDLREYIKLNHKIVSAVYDTDKGIWNLTIEADGRTFHDWSHVFVNCGGVLNSWKYPDIPGLSTFKGTICHSANWDESIDLKGKAVGLIGNGSSGIQILPAILPDVDKAYSFVRGPTWIIGGMLGGDGGSVSYTQEEKQEFANNPETHLALRKQLETTMNRLFPIFLKGSKLQEYIKQMTVEAMQQKLTDLKLQELLIPKWSVGCRRLTPGPGYLESLTDDKVTVVVGEIEKIVENGIVSSNGNTYNLDVLILATGFDTSFLPKFKLQGKNGQLLSDVWKSSPDAYMGFTVDGFPNYFMTLGPNSPVGNGSVLVAIEAQVNVMVQIIGKYQKENLKSFDVSSEAAKEFNEFKDEFMKSTIWTEDCKTWYRGAVDNSKVTALWPGSPVHYLEAVLMPRLEDWVFERYGNRFDYLGNGFSVAEANDQDIAHYISNQDRSPVDPALKRLDGQLEKLQL